MNKITHCFPEGKHKVLTMSYDDGKTADRRLLSIFNAYGIKGTFHLNSGLMGQKPRLSKEEIKALYQGHEVAAHTLTHPTIARCPLPVIVQEVLEDRRNLEQIVGYPVRGLSYPNGSYNQEIIDLLPNLGIVYSRTTKETGLFSIPDNFLTWPATCHHNQHLMDFAKEFVALDKKQYFYMMYVWGHSYEFDNDDNWGIIEEFCEFIGGREDIWYATNIEIIDYFDALKRLQFTVAGDQVNNPSALDLWINFNDRVVKIPAGTQLDLS